MKSYPAARVQALKLPSWLFKVAINVMYSHIHKNRPQIVSLDLSEESPLHKPQPAIATKERVNEAQTQATESDALPEDSGVMVTNLDDLPPRAPRYVPARPRGRLWRIVEGVVAAVLIASVVLGWLVVAEHFNSPAPAHQNQPVPTHQNQPVPTLTPVRGNLPPTRPAKILFNYHGKGEIFLDGWTPDGRYLGFIYDNQSNPDQLVNGGEHVYAWDSVTGTLKETFTLPSLPRDVQGNFAYGAVPPAQSPDAWNILCVCSR